jgi:hypothetical protein
MTELIRVVALLSDDLYEELRRASYERHVSMSQILVSALREWLAREDKMAGAAR